MFSLFCVLLRALRMILLICGSAVVAVARRGRRVNSYVVPARPAVATVPAV